MSEEQIEAPKSRRGWPKGKPRTKPTVEAIKAAADRAETPKWTIKARPNWESDDFVGVGMDGVDRLRVDPAKLKALHAAGYSLQWCTRSVRGMETPQELSKMTKGGWTPVHQSDFEHLLDGDFMPKGQDDVITVDDCMLMVRPTVIQEKAKRAMTRDAGLPLQIAEEQIGHGIPNVTGSTHKSVRNSIKKTLENIAIPE
jgi:hypothetical protein